MSDENDEKENEFNNTLPTKEDAKKVLEEQIKTNGTMINAFYEGVLGTAHPSIREFCDGVWIQALQMGLTLQEQDRKTVTDPKLRQSYQEEIQKMAKSFQGMESPLDILREAMLNAEQAEDNEE